MKTVRRYDLAAACWCERDDLFLRWLRTYAAESGVDLLVVEPLWVQDVLRTYAEGKLSCAVWLDLASDFTDAANPYTRLSWLARERGARVINDPLRAACFSDKGKAHVALQAAGLPVPFGIVVPAAAAETRVLSPDERTGLGASFFAKPCHGFAGRGVIGDAHEVRDIQRAAAAFADTEFLLQARVHFGEVHGEPAYWRVICALGDIHLCWWHPRTREYGLVMQWQIADYGLWPLLEIGHRLVQVSGLEFFSVEVARTEGGAYVLVDYVNEQIDLRPKSFFRDGVPDELVRQIAWAVSQSADQVRRAAPGDRNTDCREERLLTVAEHCRAGGHAWPPSAAAAVGAGATRPAAPPSPPAPASPAPAAAAP